MRHPRRALIAGDDSRLSLRDRAPDIRRRLGAGLMLIVPAAAPTLGRAPAERGEAAADSGG